MKNVSFQSVSHERYLMQPGDEEDWYRTQESDILQRQLLYTHTHKTKNRYVIQTCALEPHPGVLCCHTGQVVYRFKDYIHFCPQQTLVNLHALSDSILNM